jgi:hypothetical protein
LATADRQVYLRLALIGASAFTCPQGAYGGLKEKKPLSKQLQAIGKKAVKAAEAGDAAAATAAVKEYVTLAKIEKEYDTVSGGSFNPKQRRSAGDPPTAAIEAQMGTSIKALYGGK